MQTISPRMVWWAALLAATIAVAIFPRASQAAIYFGDSYGDSIGSVNRDGSGLNAKAITVGSPAPLGLAVSGGFLYGFDNSLPIKVWRAPTNGADSLETIVTATGPTEPTSGTWVSSGRVYWLAPFRTQGGTVEQSKYKMYLARATLDGRQLRQKFRVIPESMDGGKVVYRGALFAVKRDRYYTYNSIVRASLKRTRLKAKRIARVSNNVSLVAFAGEIFWIDGDIIRSTKASGRGATTQVGSAQCPEGGSGGLEVTAQSFFWICDAGVIGRLDRLSGLTNLIQTGATAGAIAATPDQ